MTEQTVSEDDRSSQWPAGLTVQCRRCDGIQEATVIGPLTWRPSQRRPRPSPSPWREFLDRGERGIEMTLTRIEAVLIEHDPFPSATEPVLDQCYRDLPAAFTDALVGLLEDLASARCWRCDTAVGYVDGYQGSEDSWQPTGLARAADGPVVALCEDCAPYAPTEPEASR